MELLDEITKAIEEGKIRQTRELVNAAIESGCTAGEILYGPLMSGLKSVGRRFSRNTGMVSDMLASARAINESLEILKPLMIPDRKRPIGRACIGTVRGDLHDIGKNIVRLLLESRAIEIVDLGVDVAPEEFVRAVTEEHCDIVCCSALLVSSVPEMKEVVEALKKAGVRDRVVVMVGGVPVTAAICRRIGADIYTADGFAAAEKAEQALLEMHGQTENEGYFLNGGNTIWST